MYEYLKRGPPRTPGTARPIHVPGTPDAPPLPSACRPANPQGSLSTLATHRAAARRASALRRRLLAAPVAVPRAVPVAAGRARAVSSSYTWVTFPT
eukprot:6151694-Prymnesium_polylepis.1